MFDWIMSWFDLVPQKVMIQLVPDATAKSLPGFHGGGLTLVANRGETFEKVMTNFNTFRGPDSQITKLFTMDGESIPFSTVITQPVTCMVKKI